MPWLAWDSYLTYRLIGAVEVGSLEQKVIFFLASVPIYLLPLVLVYLFFRSVEDRWKGLKIALAGLISWQVFSASVGYWSYHFYNFRDRPFANLGLSELLFERPSKAFPSDHSAVLMAATMGFFFYRYPKLGWLFLVLTAISSVSRVLIGFHWVGDILAGALLGLLGVGALIGLERLIRSTFRHESAHL